MTYKFGAGTLVVGFTGYSAFTGFPLAHFDEFDSVAFVSPAVGVDIVDLAYWIWKVKEWSVAFDPTFAAFLGITPTTQTFTSTAANELEIINTPAPIWSNGVDLSFAPLVVIEPGSGAYGFQSDIDQSGSAIASLVSGVGNVLTFSDGTYSTVATATTLWPWTP